VTAADLQKQIELEDRVKQDIDALHRAVNQIRGLRSNLQTLEKWAAAESPNTEVIAAAKGLDQKMSSVEANLMQVRVKNSEGNLRYPNMLKRAVCHLQRPDPERRSIPHGAAVVGL